MLSYCSYIFDDSILDRARNCKKGSKLPIENAAFITSDTHQSMGTAKSILSGGSSDAEKPMHTSAGTTKITSSSKSSSSINQPQWGILVNTNIDESNSDFQDILLQLKNIVKDIKVFTDSEQCIQFLNTVDNEKVVVITSGSLGLDLTSNIHDMVQVYAIYILSDNISEHEQWIKAWSKIKGVYTSINTIYKTLQLHIEQWNQDHISISFINSDEDNSNLNLNELDPSFMYTQIFKEIFVDMEHNEQSLKDFAIYLREQYANKPVELDTIDKFEREYDPQSAIQCYTRYTFAYTMLNKALRTLESKTLIKMGFFLRDIHRQIQQLHQQQFISARKKFVKVYRGQCLSKEDLEKLLKSRGKLISFNNFLSTSEMQDVAFLLAESASQSANEVGILFEMSVNTEMKKKFSSPCTVCFACMILNQ